MISVSLYSLTWLGPLPLRVVHWVHDVSSMLGWSESSDNKVDPAQCIPSAGYTVYRGSVVLSLERVPAAQGFPHSSMDFEPRRREELT